MFYLDDTSRFLAKVAQETATFVTEAIREFDKNGFCEIMPSLDIGFPHEVLRLAAGFPTGVYVRWESKLPFVPIDTTVNVCSSSLYMLEATSLSEIDKHFNAQLFAEWENLNKGGSYKLNFHKGNHFICVTQSENTHDIYLILHSSAAEFKQTFNGVSPTPSNWYSESIKHHRKGNRVLRYIAGNEAEQFYRIAKFSEPYNELRHDFFAEHLVRGLGKISSVKHDHHYLMPDPNSVLIGSFLLDAGATVPIFTASGDPIFVAKTMPSDKAKVQTSGKSKQLFPHGLGKRCRKAPIMAVNVDTGKFDLNGRNFQITPSESLKDHPDLETRRYNTPSLEKEYREALRQYCDAEIMDRLFPLCSYDKYGFQKWKLRT